MENIYKTLTEMLIDRNFELNQIINSNSNFDVKNKLTHKILKVYFSEQTKIGINYLKEIINDAGENNILIVYSDVITTFAKQYINSVSNTIHLFSYRELKRNIIHHYLVPKHYILNNEEKNKFIKNINVNTTHIPKCKITDPISKYYGCKEHDIMKIIRLDGDIESITYRIVT